MWSCSYVEYLVVTGTDTELLIAWRTYSDFSSLADTAKSLGARRAVKSWYQLEALGCHRRTDPSSLRTVARLLNRFLATLLEELIQADIVVSDSYPNHPSGVWMIFLCAVTSSRTCNVTFISPSSRDDRTSVVHPSPDTTLERRTRPTKETLRCVRKATSKCCTLEESAL